MSDQHHDHDYDHDDQPPAPVDRQQPSHWPTTVADAVDRLLAVLSEENQQLIRDEPDVIAFHFTLGMWIRNAFGLWQGNPALNASCAQWRRHSGEPTASSATSDTLLHSDDASAIILDALHARLRP